VGGAVQPCRGVVEAGGGGELAAQSFLRFRGVGARG
jgi:hypothetical protein